MLLKTWYLVVLGRAIVCHVRVCSWTTAQSLLTSAIVHIGLCYHIEIKIHVTGQCQVWDLTHPSINILLRIPILDILADFFWSQQVRLHVLVFSFVKKCSVFILCDGFWPKQNSSFICILLDVCRTVQMTRILSAARMHHKSLNRKGGEMRSFLRDQLPLPPATRLFLIDVYFPFS